MSVTLNRVLAAGGGVGAVRGQGGQIERNDLSPDESRIADLVANPFSKSRSPDGQGALSKSASGTGKASRQNTTTPSKRRPIQRKIDPNPTSSWALQKSQQKQTPPKTRSASRDGFNSATASRSFGSASTGPNRLRLGLNKTQASSSLPATNRGAPTPNANGIVHSHTVNAGKPQPEKLFQQLHRLSDANKDFAANAAASSKDAVANFADSVKNRSSSAFSASDWLKASRDPAFNPKALPHVNAPVVDSKLQQALSGLNFKKALLGADRSSENSAAGSAGMTKMTTTLDNRTSSDSRSGYRRSRTSSSQVPRTSRERQCEQCALNTVGDRGEIIGEQLCNGAVVAHALSDQLEAVVEGKWIGLRPAVCDRRVAPQARTERARSGDGTLSGANSRASVADFDAFCADLERRAEDTNEGDLAEPPAKPRSATTMSL